MCIYILKQHPLKARADRKRVVMLPLILFSDDISGNQSKKWHKFESWYLSFAGPPRHLNARIENINFVCSSNSVSSLDLSEPIAQQLTALETEGAFTFDASHQETVLVVAPLMCIVCDNPRASELLNHLGSATLKHCPWCMVSTMTVLYNIFYLSKTILFQTTRKENPDTLCALRTKDMALQQIAQINVLLTEADKVEMAYYSVASSMILSWACLRLLIKYWSIGQLCPGILFWSVLETMLNLSLHSAM